MAADESLGSHFEGKIARAKSSQSESVDDLFDIAFLLHCAEGNAGKAIRVLKASAAHYLDENPRFQGNIHGEGKTINYHDIVFSKEFGGVVPGEHIRQQMDAVISVEQNLNGLVESIMGQEKFGGWVGDYLRKAPDNLGDGDGPQSAIATDCEVPQTFLDEMSSRFGKVTEGEIKEQLKLHRSPAANYLARLAYHLLPPDVERANAVSLRIMGNERVRRAELGDYAAKYLRENGVGRKTAELVGQVFYKISPNLAAYHYHSRIAPRKIAHGR